MHRMFNNNYKLRVSMCFQSDENGSASYSAVILLA